MFNDFWIRYAVCVTIVVVLLKGEERCLPLYEVKMLHQFDHPFGTYEGFSSESKSKHLGIRMQKAGRSVKLHWL